MSGRGKRAAAGSSKGPSASKVSKNETLDWCADCWAVAEATCNGHRLVSRDAAEKEVQAELAAANREVARLQQRLIPLVDARVPSGPVLKVRVEGEHEPGFWIGGGDMHITLATTKTVTAKEKKVICEALEDLKIEYEMDGGSVSTKAMGDGWFDLGTLASKLPDCEAGETVRKGTVLLGGQFEVYFRDGKCKSRSKVFGQVARGDLDCLEGRGCEGDDCRDWDLDCFCRTKYARGTSLTDVEFVAAPKK